MEVVTWFVGVGLVLLLLVVIGSSGPKDPKGPMPKNRSGFGSSITGSAGS